MNKISIIVPIYNMEWCLEQNIKSLINQTNKNFNIVLVNDGSKDGSAHIIDRLSKENDNIIALHKENGGLISAYLYGIKNSSSEYVGFMDPDDYVELDMIDSVLGVIGDHCPDVVSFQFHTVFGQKKELSRSCDGTFEDKLIVGDMLENSKNNYFQNQYYLTLRNPRCNKVIKRELIESNKDNVYHKAYAIEDVCFMTPILLDARSIYHIGKPFYNYIKYEGAMNSQISDKIIDCGAGEAAWLNAIINAKGYSNYDAYTFVMQASTLSTKVLKLKMSLRNKKNILKKINDKLLSNIGLSDIEKIKYNKKTCFIIKKLYKKSYGKLAFLGSLYYKFKKNDTVST